jgi:hypothetical protein
MASSRYLTSYEWLGKTNVQSKVVVSLYQSNPKCRWREDVLFIALAPHHILTIDDGLDMIRNCRIRA